MAELGIHFDPTKTKPPSLWGDSIEFRAFRKETTMFIDCYGFGDVFGGTRDIPIANRDMS